MKKIKLFIVASLMLSLLVFGKSVSVKSAPTEDEKAVRTVVELHLHALKTGNEKALKSLWIASANKLTVTSTTSAHKKANRQSLYSEPVADAIKRWVKSPDKNASLTSFDIVYMDQKVAFLKVKINWKGSVLNETLQLIKMGKTWKLAQKTVFVAQKEMSSPY
ncbi:nuclear transport factor 2 family protein [bacterium AH-315-E10]|nr:nuclear transport factor 2 family protein [bacterium AH-315-E10]